HSNATEEVIAAALKSEFFTPELIQEIVLQKESSRKRLVLNALAKYALEHCINDSHNQVEWQEAFLLLINSAKDTLTFIELTNLIETKELINPFFGLKILAILRVHALEQL